jgi:dolichol-phosphate mannosyltransferase
MNEAACLPRLHEALRDVCDALPYEFEFLFVDDGSTDATVDVLGTLREKDVRVRYLVLSRNFGHQAALSAGLTHASGHAVIMMDGDLQHPPQLIPELIGKWEQGFDIVNTARIDSDSAPLLKRAWSWAFYRVFNGLTEIRIEPGGADFRLMGRVAVAALNAFPERHRFFRGLVPWLGFKQTVVPFKAPRRFAGHPKYTFIKNLRFALEGLTAFNFYPLRLVTAFGLTVAGSSAAYGLYALAANLAGGRTVPGWTSLILCVLFFGGSQLMMIGVLGEYLGRTFEQVTGRPLFILRAAVGVSSHLDIAKPLVPPPHHLSARPRKVDGDRSRSHQSHVDGR